VQLGRMKEEMFNEGEAEELEEAMRKLIEKKK
jgi:hypothetical protein